MVNDPANFAGCCFGFEAADIIPMGERGPTYLLPLALPFPLEDHHQLITRIEFGFVSGEGGGGCG